MFIISLCKYIYRKNVFYCFYNLTFLRKNAKLFVMILIKRENYLLQSFVHEGWIPLGWSGSGSLIQDHSDHGMHRKSSMQVSDQFLICKKGAFQNTDFSCLKCHLKQKKLRVRSRVLQSIHHDPNFHSIPLTRWLFSASHFRGYF